MNATNNPYAVTPPDKTLSIEGVAADAKAVGDALDLKQPKCIKVGSTGGGKSVSVNMSTFPKGQYLAIAPVSNFIAGFVYGGMNIMSKSENIGWSNVGSDTILNVSGLQPYSNVYLMQIS